MIHYAATHQSRFIYPQLLITNGSTSLCLFFCVLQIQPPTILVCDAIVAARPVGVLDLRFIFYYGFKSLDSLSLGFLAQASVGHASNTQRKTSNALRAT